MRPDGGDRFAMALRNALMAKPFFNRSLVSQPTMRRENESNTMARYSFLVIFGFSLSRLTNRSDVFYRQDSWFARFLDLVKFR